MVMIIQIEDGWMDDDFGQELKRGSRKVRTYLSDGSRAQLLPWMQPAISYMWPALGKLWNLGLDNEELIGAGRAALETDGELHFATASDARRKVKKKPKASSSSESDKEDIASSEALAEFRKNWLGSGTKKKQENKVRGGRAFGPSKVKEVFLIEKGKEASSKSDSRLEGEATNSMLQAALGAGDPLHGLLALQIAQNLKGKKDKKQRRRSTERQQRHPELIDQHELRRRKAVQGPLEGFGQLQEGRQEEVPQSSQTRTKIHETHRGGARCPGQAFPVGRLQSPYPFRQAAESEEVPLSALHHSGMAFEGGTASCGSPSHSDSAGHAPVGDRQQLGHLKSMNELAL